MAWDAFPPSTGTNLAYYDGSGPPYSWMRQFWEAVRERYAIGGREGSRQPDGFYRWTRVNITDMEDLGDGRIKITCKETNDSTPDWIDGDGIKRWTGFAGVYNGHDISGPPTCAATPLYFKANLYPLDNGSPPATALADPNQGVVLKIEDNGEDFLIVNDDGQLRLNGLDFGDYVDDPPSWGLDILGFVSTGPREGWGWTQRYPPHPNHTQLDYGVITKAVKIHPTDDTFTVTLDGGTTDPIDITATAAEVTDALGTVSTHVRLVYLNSSDFVVLFDAEFGDTAVTASGATASALPNKLFDASRTGWKTPKGWTDTLLSGKEIFFQADHPDASPGQKVWRRVTVTGLVSDAGGFGLTYSSTDQAGLSIATAPAVGDGYWIAAAGSFWRPFFRLALEQVTTRSGLSWMRSFGGRPFGGDPARPWEPLGTWCSAYSNKFEASHHPAADELASKTIQVTSVDLAVDAGDPPETSTLYVLNTDAKHTTTDSSCTNSFFLASPFRYYGLRGMQQWLDELLVAFDWVEKKDYAGLKAIPKFVPATWHKKAFGSPSVNIRETTITGISGGDNAVATIGAITLPAKTNNSSNTWTSLPCVFAVIKDDDVIDSGPATVTTTVITRTDGFEFHDATETGAAIVISFGRQRRYERRFKYLYDRTIFLPDTDDGGSPVVPPDAAHDEGGDDPVVRIGTYPTTAASSAYAEYDDEGILAESGDTFVTGESARYHGDSWQDHWPGGEMSDPLLPYTDIGFQGMPNVEAVSSFPRWEGVKRAGTATGGSDSQGYLEDTVQLWEVANNTLKQHTGTATGGSTTTVIDTGKGSDGFWQQANRFEKMIVEVSFDGMMTWVPRPITAYNNATQTLTVSPAFASSTSGKPYRITEPGYIAGRGAILNLWRGRQVEITSFDGSTTAKTLILYSDKHRLFFSPGAIGFTVGPGCNYRIIEYDIGTVWHRKPSGTDPLNGWVKPDNADADTRGADWHLIADSATAQFENNPTIVRNFGYFRRGDISAALTLWLEQYQLTDVLRWIKWPFIWVYKDGEYFKWIEDGDMSQVHTVANADYDSKWATYAAASEAIWEAGGPAAAVGDSTTPETPPFMVGTGSISPDCGSNTIEITTGQGSNNRAWGKIETAPTDVLNFSSDFWCKALCWAGGNVGTIEFAKDALVPNTNTNASANDAYIFNDFGSGLSFNQYFKAGSDGITGTTVPRFTTDSFGPDPLTATTTAHMIFEKPLNALDDCPGSPTHPTVVNAGFIVSEYTAILQFDVSGGLTYRS